MTLYLLLTLQIDQPSFLCIKYSSVSVTLVILMLLSHCISCGSCPFFPNFILFTFCVSYWTFFETSLSFLFLSSVRFITESIC